jgi:hypothetical protein
MIEYSNKTHSLDGNGRKYLGKSLICIRNQNRCLLFYIAKIIDNFWTKSGKSGHGGGDDLTLN